MSEYHDDKTAASDPGRLSLSTQKLRWLQPQLFGWHSLLVRYPWSAGKKLNGSQFKAMLAEHMVSGDSRAAVVVSIEPLIVAAYTDEFDRVVLLAFPQWLIADYQLQPGSRLLTVNSYGRGKKLSSDLTHGPASCHRYVRVFPVIAEFVSEDLQKIEQRKHEIDEKEWARAASLGAARLNEPLPIRDGRPLQSARPRMQ